MRQILHGHTSPATAYKVDNYPYGYTLRTSIFYWIESKKGKGDRFCSQTINPKNGRLNAPKCSTYSPFIYLYLDDKGHVTYGVLNTYDPVKFVDQFKEIAHLIGDNFNDIQKENLRMNYAGTLHASAGYWIVKYSPESKPAFKKWLSDTIVHIMNCPIESLTEHPTPPEQDNPEGEIKFVTKTLIIG